MKVLLLSLAVAIGLDEALDHGAAVSACYDVVAHLVDVLWHEAGAVVSRR